MKGLGTAIAVVLIGVGGWIAFKAIQEIVRLYNIADSDLKLGVITAGGSALAFVINNAIQSSRERRARLFEAKREAYGDFIGSFMSFFHRFAQDQEVPPHEMVNAIRSLSTDVMTWGSAATVNAFNRYQRENIIPTSDPKELFRRTEIFLRALRKDLGHNDSSLRNFALTKLLLRGDEHDNLD